MKIQHLLFTLPLFLFACGQPQNNQPSALTVSQPADESAPAPALPPADMFVGFFDAVDYDENKDIAYSNKITLAIQSLENGLLKGYSVVAGNIRPFEGNYTEKGKTVQAIVREPGDDQYDGVFTFTLDRDSQTVAGTWKANDRKLSVTKREFKLAKRVFHYDPTIEMPEGMEYQTLYTDFKTQEKRANPEEAEFLTADAGKFNASKKLLRKEDVENMHRGDLEVIRNAIYARHGYSFKNRRMRYVFDSVEWYMPVNTDVSKELTAIELQNIDLLKRYEQHAERYYDSFGR